MGIYIILLYYKCVSGRTGEAGSRLCMNDTPLISPPFISSYLPSLYLEASPLSQVLVAEFVLLVLGVVWLSLLSPLPSLLLYRLLFPHPLPLSISSITGISD